MKISKEDIVMRYTVNGRVHKVGFNSYAALGRWITTNFEGKVIISIVNMKKY